MMDETLVVLMTLPRYLPLYWVRWEGSGRIVCHLFTPANADMRQRLVDVLLSRQAHPCMLREPTRRQWYFCDAYVCEINVQHGCEVTLVPRGPLTVSDIPPLLPKRARAKRRDAGVKRTKKRRTIVAPEVA